MTGIVNNRFKIYSVSYKLCEDSAVSCTEQAGLQSTINYTPLIRWIRHSSPLLFIFHTDVMISIFNGLPTCGASHCLLTPVIKRLHYDATDLDDTKYFSISPLCKQKILNITANIQRRYRGIYYFMSNRNTSVKNNNFVN